MSNSNRSAAASCNGLVKFAHQHAIKPFWKLPKLLFFILALLELFCEFYFVKLLQWLNKVRFVWILVNFWHKCHPEKLLFSITGSRYHPLIPVLISLQIKWSGHLGLFLKFSKPSFDILLRGVSQTFFFEIVNIWLGWTRYRLHVIIISL